MQDNDIRTNHFQLPGQTGNDEPVNESVENQIYDAQTESQNSELWSEADATMVHMTGDMLSGETHDPSRYIEAMAAEVPKPIQNTLKSELENAGDNVMVRQRDVYFNEERTRQLEAENTTEANLVINDTQNLVITWRDMYKTDEGL